MWHVFRMLQEVASQRLDCKIDALLNLKLPYSVFLQEHMHTVQLVLDFLVNIVQSFTFLVLALERYLVVCRGTQYKTLWTAKRRLVVYIAVTVAIIIIVTFYIFRLVRGALFNKRSARSKGQFFYFIMGLFIVLFFLGNGINRIAVSSLKMR